MANVPNTSSPNRKEFHSLRSSSGAKYKPGKHADEEFHKSQQRYNIAMDQLTVDKLIASDFTSMTLRMVVAKHSRTALSPVLGDVLKALISRSQRQSNQSRADKNKKELKAFYCATNYTTLQDAPTNVRTFGSLGSGEMQLNAPLGISASTFGLPRGGICRIAITDTGNNRVQVWTLMARNPNKKNSSEGMKFNGLVGLDTLFQEEDFSDSDDDGSRYHNSESRDKVVTPDTVIERQRKIMEQKARRNARNKIRSTFGSRRGQFANPRGVTFGASKTDAMRIFVSDNTIDKHLGSPRVQVMDLDGVKPAKVSYVIDNSSLASPTLSNSIISHVYGVKPGGDGEFVYTDSNGIPIMQKQSDRITVSVAAGALEGYSDAVHQQGKMEPNASDRVPGFCWTFPRHARELNLETMILCCLESHHEAKDVVRSWFDVLNREPKTENCEFLKSRKARVDWIENGMDHHQFASGIKPHFSMHLYQHHLAEHITGSSKLPTDHDVNLLTEQIDAAFGLKQSDPDKEYILNDVIAVAFSVAEDIVADASGEVLFDDEHHADDHGKDKSHYHHTRASSHSRSSSSLSRTITRQSSRVPPTHGNKPPCNNSLKIIQLQSVSRFLQDKAEIEHLYEELIEEHPRRHGESKLIIEHTDFDRRHTIASRIKAGSVEKLKDIITDMLFEMLFRHIRYYDQLDDSYLFEPSDMPGSTFVVPRSSIHGASIQAYIVNSPSEIGIWREGTAVGVDRETGLYIFEYNKKNQSRTGEIEMKIKLISRSKLRTNVPKCQNLFSMPWSMCQAKLNGHGHLFASDFEMDCIHVFDGVKQQLDVRTSEEKASTIFEKDNTRKYLYTIGCRGSSRGELRGPKGVCFDHANRLIVADCNNNRIQGFEYLPEAANSSGDPLHPGIVPKDGAVNGRWICTFVYPEEDHSDSCSIGTPGTSVCAKNVASKTRGMPALSRPSDVTVDDHENILVADTGNSCIRLLRLKVFKGPYEKVDSATINMENLWMYKATLSGDMVRIWPYLYLECIATWGCRGFGPGAFISPCSIDHYTFIKEEGSGPEAREVKEQRYLIVDQATHKVTQFTLTPSEADDMLHVGNAQQNATEQQHHHHHHHHHQQQQQQQQQRRRRSCVMQ